MNEEITTKIDNNYTLSDLFNLLKKSIMNNTNVATLALYTSTIKPYNKDEGYGIIEAKPFPLKNNQTEYIINCYVLDDRTFTGNQILTVIYTDLMFIDNLQVDRSSPKKAKNQILHSQMAGVIINDNPLSIIPDPDDDSYIILSYNNIEYKLKKY